MLYIANLREQKRTQSLFKTEVKTVTQTVSADSISDAESKINTYYSSLNTSDVTYTIDIINVTHTLPNESINIIQGPTQVTGSLSISSGSLTVTTASFSLIEGGSPIRLMDSVSFESDITSSGTLSSSANIIAQSFTGSFSGSITEAISSSYAQTASYVETAQTASYVETAQTASYVAASNIDQPFTNLTSSNLLVTGTASINLLYTTYESSSIIYSSGSTKFGDTFDDFHQFTGSISSTGSNVDFTGATGVSGSFSGSFEGEGSGITGIISSSYTITSSHALNVLYKNGTGTDSIKPVAGSNTASGPYASIGGGCSNILRNSGSFIGGGKSNEICIGGFNNNCGKYGTIGGGLSNTNNSYAGTIAGGNLNTVSNLYSTVAGGKSNSAAARGVVGGGSNNNASGDSSGILGGRSNTANASCSFIIGSSISSTVSNHTHVNNLTTAGNITGSNISASGYISASEFVGLITNAQTASYVETAQTASFVTLAQTASYVTTAQTASYVLNAVSSSYAVTASHALNSDPFPYTGSALITNTLTLGTSLNDFDSALIVTGSTIVTGNVSSSNFLFAKLQETDTSGLKTVVYDTTTGQFFRTGSYGGGGGEGFPFSGSAEITGSLLVSGSFVDFTNAPLTASIISASSGITGSLLGTASTASYVENAQTASFVTLAQTASYVTMAQTASYVTLAQTASYVLNAVSSSYATTASYVLNAQTASYVETAQTASFVTLAQTASYVTTAQTASFVLNAISSSYALSASYAISASHEIIKEVSSSYADTASYVETSQTASYVLASSIDQPFTNITASGNISASGTIDGLSGSFKSLFVTGSLDVFVNLPVTTEPKLRVGRDDLQYIGIGVGDYDNIIVAKQDPDSGGHGNQNFILNRDFDGGGTNNFKIQKDGIDQFVIDTSGNITASGNISASGGDIFGNVFNADTYVITPNVGRTTTTLVEFGNGSSTHSNEDTDIVLKTQGSGEVIVDIGGNDVIKFLEEDIAIGKPFRGLTIASGSWGYGDLIVSGSITVSGSTINELTASYAMTASHAMNVQPENNFMPITTHTANFNSTSSYAGHYNIVGGNLSITVTTGSTPTDLTPGMEWNFFQTSSGASFTFTEGTGVEIVSRNNHKKLAAVGSAGTLKYISGQTFHLVGDLTI